MTTNKITFAWKDLPKTLRVAIQQVGKAMPRKVTVEFCTGPATVSRSYGSNYSTHGFGPVLKTHADHWTDSGGESQCTTTDTYRKIAFEVGKNWNGKSFAHVVVGNVATAPGIDALLVAVDEALEKSSETVETVKIWTANPGPFSDLKAPVTYREINGVKTVVDSDGKPVVAEATPEVVAVASM